MVVTDFKRDRVVLVDSLGHPVKKGTVMRLFGKDVRIIDAHGPRARVIYPDDCRPYVVTSCGTVDVVDNDTGRNEREVELTCFTPPGFPPRLAYVLEADLAKAEGV